MTDMPHHRDRPGEVNWEKRMDAIEILGRSIMTAAAVAGALGLYMAVARFGGWHLVWISAGAVAVVVAVELAGDRLDRGARRRQGLPVRPVPIGRGHFRSMVLLAVVQWFIGFWWVTTDRPRDQGGDTTLVLGVALLAAAACTTFQVAGKRRYVIR